MKHVAIIYERELDIGGVETHLLSLFSRADPQRYRFTLLAPVSPGYQVKIARLGVQAISLEPYKPLSGRALRRMIQVFRTEQVDLVHAHSPTAAVPGRLAARWLGIPAVVTVHIAVGDYHGVLHTLRASSGRRLYTWLDKTLNQTMTAQMIYVSQTGYAQSVRQHASPAERSSVIPNGIDLDRFSSTPAEIGALRREICTLHHQPLDLPVIIFAGRFSDQKGLDLLLEALQRVNQTAPQSFNLWLVGAGPLEGELRTQAASAGLAERVCFLGPSPAIGPLLAAADLFVLPSRWEAMSISLLEAIASGLPCVVSDVGDNAIVIENEVEGLVVPPDDVTALAAALEKLLSQPDLRRQMGRNARQKSQRFSDVEMVRQVQVVYAQTLH